MRKRVVVCILALYVVAAAAQAGAADKSGPLAPVGVVGEYMNDAATTAEVKARILAEKSLEGADIKVTTTDSVVRLDGSVRNAAQSELAARIAGGLSNVKSVANHLAVKR